MKESLEKRKSVENWLVWNLPLIKENKIRFAKQTIAEKEEKAEWMNEWMNEWMKVWHKKSQTSKSRSILNTETK